MDKRQFKELHLCGSRSNALTAKVRTQKTFNAITMASAGQRPTESGAIHWSRACGQRPAFTMADRLSLLHKGLDNLRSAFTMAEILLSLTIIGVVAAITLPSLTGNINERTWNTQRKALYARISQAISLMPALNGYGISPTETDTINKAAETFLTSGLSKVLKINNICDNEHLKDCGIAEKIITANANRINIPKNLSDLNTGITTSGPVRVFNTKAAAFETANGESILAFYNPNCNTDSYGSTNGSTDAEWYIQQNVCANFVYDLNGNKGPNTVGKDIGVITVIYPVDSSVVAPIPRLRSEGAMKQQLASSTCTNLNDDYRLPNIDELISIYYNNNVFDLGRATTGAGTYWSSNLTSSTHALVMTDVTGRKLRQSRDSEHNVRCVKR